MITGGHKLPNKYVTPKWRPDALSIAITVAASYFEKEFLYEFFKEEMAMLQEASIVQDWINQGIEKGFERGMEKGLEKGRRTGEIEAIRAVILDVLVERFGSTKKAISRGLDAIDNPTILRFLHRESMKAASLEDFEKLVEGVVKE